MPQHNNLVLQETNRAIRLAEKGRTADAWAIYSQIADKVPDDLEARVQFVQLCLNLGNAETAKELLLDLTRDHPDNAFYLGMLGFSYMKLDEITEAERTLLKSIELDPDLWMAHTDLGVVYASTAQHENAIEHLEKAIRLKPSHAESYVHLLHCLTNVRDRQEDVLKWGEKALRLDPKNAYIYDRIGVTLGQLGRISEAISYFEKAMALDSSLGTVYLNFSIIKKFSIEDRPFIDKIEKQLKTGLPAIERAYFHFTLGKVYNDCREYDKAFINYRQGNFLAKSQHPEPPDLKHLVKLLGKIFTKERLSAAPNIGNNTDIPIFIVGMPRSGTSLIEQIISRHSSAAGAGELDTIHIIADNICLPSDQKNYVSKWLKHLDQADFDKDTESYLDTLRKDKEDSLRITDKLPENYRYLGFIHLLFPNAKIIHAMRNPLDTCLSCYFQPFPHVHWSYDMKWIAEHYQQYRQVMDYWKRVFPPGVILDVNYESLIENQEEESRRLIAHCGLNWEESCLDYKKEQRAVATASLWQVRQPLYKSSVKRWMNYAPHIVDIAKNLSKYLDSDDIESLKQIGIKVKTGRWW